ncbi:MAG: hypothetical protein Q4G61_06745 [Tissierellia bacterium]|nr:hypothetical protein [Tissierellia bacterium]
MIKKTNTIAHDNEVFKLTYTIMSALMLLNFFLTPNPYSAFHSGRAATGADVISYKFFITPAFLVILTLLIIILLQRKLLICRITILYSVILIITGLINGGLLSSPITYIYNIIVWILLVSVVLLQVHKDNQDALIDEKICARRTSEFSARFIGFLSFLLVLGFAIASFFPKKYGLLTYDFSRIVRGEVTLWSVFGLFTLFPVYSLYINYQFDKKRYLLISCIIPIIALSVANRTDFILSILPFMIILSMRVVRRFGTAVSLLVSIQILIIIIVSIRIISIDQSIDWAAMSTGRTNLWSTHWEVFISSPLIGIGPFDAQLYSNIRLMGNSEVGFLRWFSENGIFIGSFLVIILAIATKNSLKELVNGYNTSRYFIPSLIVLSLLPNVVQSHGRILDIKDMLFWFNILYMYLSKFNSKYTIIKP